MVHLECFTFAKEVVKLFNAVIGEVRFIRTACPSEISCNGCVDAAYEGKVRNNMLVIGVH